MKRYWIDYSTSVGIFAENEEDAIKRFWEDNYEEFGSGEIQIDCVEKEDDEE